MYEFGSKSKSKMAGVRAELCDIAMLAIQHSDQDFCFFDGKRTLAEQKKLVARGMSRTLHSKHLTGDAMDLVPIVAGRPVWDWKLIYHVVCAVDFAATKLNLAKRIVWGGAWDRRLSDFAGDPEAYKREVILYCERHPGKDFIDGPHFEWRV